MEEFKNTKTSFEIKLKGNDSSDEGEIYITNECDDMFLSKPDLKERRLSEEYEKIDMNPFTDTLANSEAIPKTKKLDVQIEDDYMLQKSEH